MNCMKCGREIEDSQIFCPKCLEIMEKYPVKTDVVIKIPVQPDPSAKKAQPRKKVRTPEEQVLLLKRRNRWLTATVCFLLAVSVALAFLSIDVLRQLDIQRLLGQNYSTVEPTR